MTGFAVPPVNLQPEPPMLRFVREPYRSRIDEAAKVCGPVVEVALQGDGIYVVFANGSGQVFFMSPDDRQLRMVREAGSVGEAQHLLTMVDMTGLLLDAGYRLEVIAEALNVPIQGNVARVQRLREAMDIARAWPDDLLKARQCNAPWHSLREPARWWRLGQVEREAVVDYTTAYLAWWGRWPTIDDYRRSFGHRPTVNRDPAPGQDQLGPER